MSKGTWQPLPLRDPRQGFGFCVGYDMPFMIFARYFIPYFGRTGIRIGGSRGLSFGFVVAEEDDER